VPIAEVARQGETAYELCVANDLPLTMHMGTTFGAAARWTSVGRSTSTPSPVATPTLS
jgi:hypothetical protein